MGSANSGSAWVTTSVGGIWVGTGSEVSAGLEAGTVKGVGSDNGIAVGAVPSLGVAVGVGRMGVGVTVAACGSGFGGVGMLLDETGSTVETT